MNGGRAVLASITDSQAQPKPKDSDSAGAWQTSYVKNRCSSNAKAAYIVEICVAFQINLN